MYSPAVHVCTAEHAGVQSETSWAAVVSVKNFAIGHFVGVSGEWRPLIPELSLSDKIGSFPVVDLVRAVITLGKRRCTHAVFNLCHAVETVIKLENLFKLFIFAR